MPRQWLGRLCAKIKFLKINVRLHFMIKLSKLARIVTRDSVPKNCASIAYRVFKKFWIKTNVFNTSLCFSKRTRKKRLSSSKNELGLWKRHWFENRKSYLYSISFYIQWGFAPRSNPLPFCVPFWQKRYPLCIPTCIIHKVPLSIGSNSE